MRRFFILERKKLELIMSVLMILCAIALAERGWKQTLGEHVTGNTGKTQYAVDFYVMLITKCKSCVQAYQRFKRR